MFGLGFGGDCYADRVNKLPDFDGLLCPDLGVFIYATLRHKLLKLNLEFGICDSSHFCYTFFFSFSTSLTSFRSCSHGRGPSTRAHTG